MLSTVATTPGRSVRHDGKDVHSHRLERGELNGQLHSPVALPLTTELEPPFYSSGFSSEYKMVM